MMVQSIRCFRKKPRVPVMKKMMSSFVIACYSPDWSISKSECSNDDDRILQASDLANLVKRHNVPYAFVDDLM